MTTPEQIEANKERTKQRRAANARRAKSRQKGLKNLELEEAACNHHFTLTKGVVVALVRQTCPRCLRRRMRYYRARARAAEGAGGRKKLSVHAREFLQTSEDRARAEGGAILETVLAGRGRKGDPACATVGKSAWKIA